MLTGLRARDAKQQLPTWVLSQQRRPFTSMMGGSLQDESRAAKKNKKRRAKKTGESSSAAFDIIEDVSMVMPPSSEPSPPPAPVDPIAQLKQQIEEAKAAKDHARAQELRQKMWVVQDTLVLGKAGPGAPKLDIGDVLTTSEPKGQAAKAGASAPITSSSDPTEKKLSRLRKKLAQIEVLKQKLEKGVKLEATQIAKLQTEPEVLEEISLLEELLADVT